MKKWIKNNERLWMGVLSIVVGVIMLAWLSLTTRTIVIIAGIGLLVTGLFMLAGYFRLKKKGILVRTPLTACVCLLAGLCLVIMPQIFVNILMVVFGILLVLGAIDQITTLALGRRSGLTVPIFFFIAPAIVLLVGLYIMFSPEISARAFMVLFGVTVIIFGIVVLYDEYTLNNGYKLLKGKDEEESV